MLLFFLALSILNVETLDLLENIPFEKAKVLYHKQRICIFRPGQPRCYGSEKIPGDPNEVADLYLVQKKFQTNIKNLTPDNAETPPSGELKN